MICIFLSVNNRDEVLEIPIVPPEFSVTKPQGDDTFETVTGAELSFIDVPGLKSIAWESFFPSKDYPFIKGERLDDVWQYGYKIDTWVKRKLPVRLIISGTPINMACKISQFDYKINSTGDINYSIAFKEMPLINTESEELTMAQYEELLGRINDLQAAVQSLSGDRVINTPEDGAPFYNQALSDLQNAGYINGTGENLDLTEDMARIITVMYRILKDKGIL